MKALQNKLLFWVFAFFIGYILMACSAGSSGSNNSQVKNLPSSESKMDIASVSAVVKQNNLLKANSFASNELAFTRFQLRNDRGNLADGIIDGDSIKVDLRGQLATASRLVFFETSDKTALVYVNGVKQDSGNSSNSFANPVIYTIKSADGSISRNYTVTVNYNTESSKEITAYSLLNSNGVQVPGKFEDKHNIVVDMGTETNLQLLKAVFTTTGKEVTVNGIPQVSGETANNFTNQIKYIVTAEDTSTESYFVTVISDATKTLTKYSVVVPNGSKTYEGIIDGQNVTVRLPYDTNLKSLIAKFKTTGNQVLLNGVKQNSGDFVDFTKQPLIYKVIARNNDSLDYTVKVKIESSTQNKIESFSINGVNGIISQANKTITVSDLPISSDLTSLSPVFITNGVKVTVDDIEQKSESSVVDFSKGPKQYVVTAANESTATYTVTVTRKQNKGAIVLYALYPFIDGYWNERILDTKIHMISFDKVNQIFGTDKQIPAFSYRYAYAATPSVSVKLISDPLGKYLFVRGNGVDPNLLCMRNIIQALDFVSSSSGELTLGPINSRCTYGDHPIYGKTVINPKSDSDFNYMYQLYKFKNGDVTIDSYKINNPTGDVDFNDGYYKENDQKFDIAINPQNGKYAYITNSNYNTITGYVIDSTTGSLAKLALPTTNSGGENAHNIVIDTEGKYAYVDNQNTKNIVTFAINTDGSLTQKQSIDTELKLPVINMTMDPQGGYLYVNTGSNITTYSIDKDTGLLTKTANHSVPNTPLTMSIDPDGQYLSVIDNTCKMFMYVVDKDLGGLLKQVSSDDLKTSCSMANPPTMVMKDFN
ncbi:MAG: beta-propeller fold lactonase family protein [Neisseriaceae bacterium]